MLTGRCECGQVSFEVEEDSIRETVTACHCSQCRRLSGHVWASTHAPMNKVTFTCEEGLTWYQSSSWARRGFCRFCGSNLFYQENDEDGIGISAGCLDQTTDLRLAKHIFVADKGDYYALDDNLPHYEAGTAPKPG
ncbi:GFA family protein [Coralliovum pocilloporae]|uniref:GFA family protein n=1 Tax=Coralliovum pocilloporae TaxID=3066369 RepID=UPI003306A36A